MVIAFYRDESNAYILPGMKDCVAYKNDDGVTVTEQKCLLLSTLKELYIAFKEKHQFVHVGFSTFAKLKPRSCLLAGSSGTHMVCVCSIHQNVKLLILGNLLDFLKQI